MLISCHRKYRFVVSNLMNISFTIIGMLLTLLSSGQVFIRNIDVNDPNSAIIFANIINHITIPEYEEGKDIRLGADKPVISRVGETDFWVRGPKEGVLNLK